jgi:hypothetical protein
LRAPAEKAAPVAVPDAATPTPPDDALATVVVTGDASRVWLESASGRFPAGRVPPGTYRVKAFFEGADPVSAGEIVVEAGQTRELRCVSALLVCR